jgi:NAD+ diphosphatase
MTGSTLYYSGMTMDRASDRRADPELLVTLLSEPGTRVLPLWRDQCVVRNGSPVSLPAAAAGEVIAAAGDVVFLGMDRDTAMIAVDVSGLDQPAAVERAGADDVVDVRGLVSTVTPAEAGVLAYARGILHWHRNQRFCGACGGRTDSGHSGHLRTCRDCGKLLFPRIEPAIIVLVELPGTPPRCLLGRHAAAGPDRFSTLAGFVEVGESLEDAVRREVAEEAGVTVDSVSYRGSQAWPFPAGLMVGFRAEAVADTIGVDGVELAEARWFTAADIRARISAAKNGNPYRIDSIGKILIEGWLADNE